MALIPKYAVVSIDRSEGNESVGTQWQDTYIVPLDMSLRDMAKGIFGDELAPDKMPKGRVTFSIPEFLPKGFQEPTI